MLWVLIFFAFINGLLSLRLYVDNDAYSMLSDSTQVKQDINYFKDHFGGIKTVNIVFKNDQTPFNQSESLKKIWQIHGEIKKVKEVVHVESFASLIALINKEMKEGHNKDYTIPDDDNLIAQYMLTLSRDDFSPYISIDKKANQYRYHS